LVVIPHTVFPFAYIGPGAGFAFLGSFLSLVLAVLAGLASLLLWPFRMLRLLAKRWRGSGKARVKKLIFLGLDGLDPALTERFLAEGKLPNLAQLSQTGSYRRLRTTFPALSPVAWSTFATGVNPGRHNIFDFLNRDLRSCAPELSSCRVRPPRRVLRIGRFRIPLSRPFVEMRRKSEPFWKILARHAVRCTILRVPITFPPDDFNGLLLSAMSTPDLRGTQGTFSLFTTGAPGENRYPLSPAGDGLEGALTGPDNAFVDAAVPLSVPFRVRRPFGAHVPELEIQGRRYPLVRGEYTPWIRLRFRAAPGLAVHGIARFLLTRTGPDFEIYATPVQIDPESPALPISQPGFYAAYLAKLIGSFSTLGMAEDTWALNEGAIDEDAFLEQAALIQREREAMFFSALDHTRRGVVACVFDTTDRVQHMFFRHLHTSSAYQLVIENLYRDMDRLVGQTLAHMDPDTALFVLSDHGFCAFRRGVNLNAWLLREGYLRMPAGVEAGVVDWSETRAYTVGLGGLYLNLRGREARGIVAPEDAEELKSELIGRLTGLRDDETGEIAVQRAYAASTIYSGPYLGGAPDIIVGYAAGYRASWDAALGQVSPHVFEDNEKAWSGDHCVDPVLVPGVLFSNLKVDAVDPGIEDMAPTALHLFGVTPPKWMEGASVIPP
jgi:predicted AlkP superfamily phosphohydrolase/phosphomutase